MKMLLEKASFNVSLYSNYYFERGNLTQRDS